MDMDRMTKSLMKWLEHLGIKVDKNERDLCDGSSISQVLNYIVPEYFTGEWLSKIKTSVSYDNWRLRISNLKKINEKIMDYYADVLDLPLKPPFDHPDPSAIGKDYNLRHLGRLLQLILGIAVNCDRKEEFIQQIMSLEEGDQVSVMEAIQELMMSSGGGRERIDSMSLNFPDSLNTRNNDLGGGTRQIRRFQDELQQERDAKETIAQRCFELENELRMMKNEKETLQQQIDMLEKKVKESNQSPNHVPHSPIINASDELLRDRHFAKLQKRNKSLEEDLIKTETSKEELRIRIEILEKESLEMKLENEELQRKADEARQLKDELDISKHISDKVVKYEAAIENYKKKMDDLKRQLKATEEKNNQLSTINDENESEIKKTTTFRVQLDMYKKQVQDLHIQLAEAKHAQEKSQAVYRSLEERFIAMKLENAELNRIVNQLKEETDMGRGRGFSLSEDSIKTLNNEIMAKAEATRKASCNDTKMTIIQGSLEEMAKRVNELEVEKMVADKRIKELERLNGDGQNNQIQNLTEEVMELEAKVAQMQRQMDKKDEEMAEMEGKYKKYVSKAKEAVKTLQPLSLNSEQSASLSEDVNILRTAVQEKEKRIAEMEMDAEKNKALVEMEEKLMTIAIHKIAANFQRRAAADRISRYGSANSGTISSSFLTRQRQVNSRKQNNQAVNQSDCFD